MHEKNNNLKLPNTYETYDKRYKHSIFKKRPYLYSMFPLLEFSFYVTFSCVFILCGAFSRYYLF